jgi:hypothetical protein
MLKMDHKTGDKKEERMRQIKESRAREENLIQIISDEIEKVIGPNCFRAYGLVDFFDRPIKLFPMHGYPGGESCEVAKDGIHYLRTGYDKGRISLWKASEVYLRVLEFAKHPGQELTPEMIRADVAEDIKKEFDTLTAEVKRRYESGFLPEHLRPSCR